MFTDKPEMENIQHLELKATKIRKRLLEMIYTAKSGHTGGSLSSVDILVSLYFHIMNIRPEEPGWQNRDRFIMSKGHSVESLYCVLAEAGFFEYGLLNTYGKFASPLAGHPTKKVPGIELNSGSLGHGLSVGVGMALAAKMDKKDYRVFVLMGDGEQGEGSIMEAAMSAAHYKLDNLVAIIDRNKLQISGATEDVMSLGEMRLKWEAFGWHVADTDGNDIQTFIHHYNELRRIKNKPCLMIAHTVKGKGVSFIENNYKWHHKVPDEKEFHSAIEELTSQIRNEDKNKFNSLPESIH